MMKSLKAKIYLSHTRTRRCRHRNYGMAKVLMLFGLLLQFLIRLLVNALIYLKNTNWD